MLDMIIYRHFQIESHDCHSLCDRQLVYENIVLWISDMIMYAILWDLLSNRQGLRISNLYIVNKYEIS